MDVVFEGVVFRRGPRTVVDVPALTFHEGRTTALIGPNGAGKSTMLRLISALERPAAGVIRFGGQPATPATARKHVAYAFQRAVFLTGTVGQNIDLALRLRGVAKDERAVRLHEAAEACDIAHLLGRSAHRISGGEAQRANLARALSLRAPITLLDEPLSGLDGPGRRQLLHDLPALLRRFATTTIVVTHDRDEALRLAEDLVVLIDGRVRASGPRPEVFGAPTDSATAAFLGYSLLPVEGGVLAVAPRALRPGSGDFTFSMEVEEVLDFGVRREAWGTISGVHVSVRLQAADIVAGGRLQVFAPASTVRRFPA
ncbi:MAG: ATP-binding cassette domain-containing protein [Dehalococcoidia bacterium]